MRNSWRVPIAVALLAASTGRTEIIDTDVEPPDVRIHGQPQVAGTPRNSVGAKVAVGDFNADGIPDLATSGPRVTAQGVTIILGRPTWPASLDLRTTPPDVLVREESFPLRACLAHPGWNAPEVWWTTLGAGDVTGDAIDDLIVGGPCWAGPDGTDGMVFVVPGRRIWPSEVRINPDTWSPAILGPVIPGRWISGYFGASVAVGDLDGDRIADLVIGASETSSLLTGAGAAGRVYVVPGPIAARQAVESVGRLLDGTPGAVRLGRVVATGYLSMDLPQVILLGQNEDLASGRVMLFDPARLELGASVDGSSALLGRVAGALLGDGLGQAVDLGDVDCSGWGDLLTNSFSARRPDGTGQDTGRVDLFRDVDRPMNSRVPELTIYGRKDRLRSGTHGMVYGSALGDLDGDGFDDIVVYEFLSDAPIGGVADRGSVTIVWNRPDLPPVLDLETDSEWQLTLIGSAIGWFYGYPVGTADLDGNGRNDLMVGSLTQRKVGDPWRDWPDGGLDIFTRNLHVTTVQPEAGPDQSVDLSAGCSATVTLDASASADTGGNALRHRWYEGTTPLAEGEIVSVTLPVGEHCIRLYSTSAGGWAQDKVHVTVRELVAPEIRALTVNPVELWPPNHRMWDVHVVVDAWDECTPTAELAVKLVSVTSNEPSEGRGDGRSDPDVAGWDIGAADVDGELRAERSGRGGGREYTLGYEVRDASGNVATATAIVVVAHDRSHATRLRR